MVAEPALAIAVSAREWPDRLRQSLADHGGARVRLTALSPHDLDDEQHDVLLIDDISSFLTRGLVSREHGRRRRVIGVYDPAEPAGRQHLVDLGVDEVLSCDDSAEAFLASARRLAVTVAERSRRPETPDIDEPDDSGALVDVRGISGGVGASEVALALAGALGRAAVVELGLLPSLAHRIGLDLHPNMATAIEIVDHEGGDLGAALQRANGDVAVLVGTAEPVETGRGATRRVIEAVRRRTPWTVLDTGFASGAPLPTDHTVFVSTATPVGLGRCVDALRDKDVTETHLLLNRAPRGGFERAEIMHTVLSELRPRSVTIAPEDPAVTGAAWNGRPVQSGAFLRAVGGLAIAIGGAA